MKIIKIFTLKSPSEIDTRFKMRDSFHDTINMLKQLKSMAKLPLIKELVTKLVGFLFFKLKNKSLNGIKRNLIINF